MRNRFSLMLAAFMTTAFIQPAAATEITDETFRCLNDMTPVRHFYVDNLLGMLLKLWPLPTAPTEAPTLRVRWCSWCLPRPW
jgi:hypothetical protein